MDNSNRDDWPADCSFNTMRIWPADPEARKAAEKMVKEWNKLEKVIRPGECLKEAILGKR